jgi:hypothetical protein
MHERDVWVVLPIGLNLFWLCATVVMGTTSFPHDGLGCVLVALLTSAIAMFGIFGFVVHDIGPGKTFVAMLAQTIVLICLFAVLYLYRLDIERMTYADALYYSTLTWTSLGYADLSPVGDMRLVTALQAITGYVFLGLLVSVLSGVVGQKKTSSE